MSPQEKTPFNLNAEAQKCLKCGLCLAECPTYRAQKMERYGSRGRVQIAGKYLENDLCLSREVKEAVTSCLLCEACRESCPSGVKLDRIFGGIRHDLYQKYGTGAFKRIIFETLKNPLLLRLGARVISFGQKNFVLPLNIDWKVGSIPLTKFPILNKRSFLSETPDFIPSEGKRIGKVIYFMGCATDLIFKDTGTATIKILRKSGYDIEIPKDQRCCSIPVFLSGAREMALPNIEKNLALLDRPDIDLIVVDCATCASALKRAIPSLLEDMNLDQEKALRVSKKVKPITEIIAENLNRFSFKSAKSPLTVCYHDPCHLSRGVSETKYPRQILNSLPGVNFIEMDSPKDCCGGGGAFQFEHVEISRKVTQEKLSSIRRTYSDIVATSCPGCLLTLSGNLTEPEDPIVCHLACLVADKIT